MSKSWYLMKTSNDYQSVDEINQYGLGIFNEILQSSPEKSTVLIDQVSHDTIVQTTNNKVDDERILLTHLGIVERGTLISYRSKNWIVFSMIEDNNIHQSSIMKLCNSLFPIRSNYTRVPFLDEQGNQVYDDDGRALSTNDYAIKYDTPCIVQNRTVTTQDTDQILLPEGYLNITMKYVVADNVKQGVEFTMYDEVYEIRDIDYSKVIDDKGILTIYAKRKVENE